MPLEEKQTETRVKVKREGKEADVKAARRQGPVKNGLREAIEEAMKVVIWAKWGVPGEQGGCSWRGEDLPMGFRQ